MAGYAGSPLPKKLGIKAGHKVCLLNAPGSFVRKLSSEDVRIAHDLRLPPVDVVVLFVDRVADLERRFADITARLHPSGGFWVAWPKCRRGCDITEDVVRRNGVALDFQQCVIMLAVALLFVSSLFQRHNDVPVGNTTPGRLHLTPVTGRSIN